MSTKRLSKAQREDIIINHLNGKETPGYEVKENTNGKFIVKAIPKIEAEPIKNNIEIEEEEINDEESFSHEEERKIEDNMSKTFSQKSFRGKQNARELLRQLSQLLVEDEEFEDENESQQKESERGQFIERRYKPGEQCWRRKRLVLN